MAKDNISIHTMRLNLDNEQHLRVYNVLADLNTEIHKSQNQFIINAVDFYIKSFEREDLTLAAFEEKNKGCGFITESDLKDAVQDVKQELLVLVRDEVIKMLGTALIGRQVLYKETQGENSESEIEESDELMGLVGKWG